MCVALITVQVEGTLTSHTVITTHISALKMPASIFLIFGTPHSNQLAVVGVRLVQADHYPNPVFGFLHCLYIK